MNIFIIIIAIVFFILFFYLLSRLQMKAWLKEIDLSLSKQFVDFINKTKTEKDDKTQK